MLTKKALFCIIRNFEARIFIIETFLRTYFVMHDNFSSWRFRLYPSRCFLHWNIGLYIYSSIIYKNESVFRWSFLLNHLNIRLMFEYSISKVGIIHCRFTWIIKIESTTFHRNIIKLSSDRPSSWWNSCLLNHIHYVAAITPWNKAAPSVLHRWRA